MNMKLELKPNNCRVCFQKSKKLRSIYEPLDEGDDPPIEMMRKLTGVTVEASDEKSWLPKKICKNCELSLNLAYQFRLKVLKSQRIIKQAEFEVDDEEYDSEEDFLIVKTEANMELSIGSSQPSQPDACTDDEDNAEYLSDYAVDEIMEEQQKDESQVEENYESLSCDNDVEIPANLETIGDFDISINMLPTCNSVNDERKRVKRCKIVRNRLPSQNHGEINTKTNGDLKNIKSKPAEESDYSRFICDVCGNIFAKRSRLMEHRRRHNKELSFACEFCDLRFSMREKLRRHMFMHSGGKPYKCSFCSRTFYYESVKKAHEAVHRGYKPYVCEKCHKAFAYSHALKKHELIHENIKYYHCQYCNKDFRLPHHMKQHEETKLHQTAVLMAQQMKT